MLIQSISDFRLAIRQGSHCAIGGYPLAFHMADGESICPGCAKANRRECLAELAAGPHAGAGGWTPVALEINFEDPNLICAHCNARIPSAYAEPEESK